MEPSRVDNARCQRERVFGHVRLLPYPFASAPSDVPSAAPDTADCTPPPSDSIFGYVPPAGFSTTLSAGEHGMRFMANQDLTAIGIKYFVGSVVDKTNAHVGTLWNSDGSEKLGTAEFPSGGEVANTWETAYFDVPVDLARGATYVVSRSSSVAGLPKANGFFSSSAHSNSDGTLTALRDGSDGWYNGGYATAGEFPSAPTGGANFYVDVVVAQPLSLWNNAKPMTNGSTGITAELGIKFQSRVPGRVVGIKYWVGGTTDAQPHNGRLWDANGNQVNLLTFEPESPNSWNTAYFTGPTPISAYTTYTVSRTGAVTGLPKTFNYFNVTSGSFFPKPMPVRGMLFTMTDTAGAPNAAIASLGVFPNRSSAGSNYSVDVLFIPTSY